MNEPTFRLDLEAQLLSFTNDPLGFVRWAFPWGEPGPLSSRVGPEAWQEELLRSLGRRILTPDEAIREATVSGNGVGKSALVSWIILWAHSTFPDTRGVVTANTEVQLKTKTWAELGKWYNLFIAKELFTLEATALYSRDPDHKLTWRTDMIAWSEKNAVAFQGLHNEGKRLFMIFDEASGIANTIWEAGDGCMTDAGTQRIWAVFGNPNSPSGRFRDCFDNGKEAWRWNSRRVDARTVSFADKAEHAAWIRIHGEDSDYVRVRVKGTFPRTGAIQFISPDEVGLAQVADLNVHPFDPLIIGVDVARFGDDASVIFIRKGRDARTFDPIVLRNVDTMTLASHVNETYLRYRADAVFVDGGGVGGGVIDRLRQLGCPVLEVQFGAKADRGSSGESGMDDGTRYANKRAEMWGFLRAALRSGLAIPSSDTVFGDQISNELTGPQYSYNLHNEILLEAKKDMKARGVLSPDIADALALTYAYSVVPNRNAGGLLPKALVETEYDPFENIYGAN
jgi:hypothetical protein